jgi:aspartyl-tRNA synthetase
MAYRTHNCGELKLKEDKKSVTLIGWAQRIRDHGGKKFIDLRDREGITQVVFDPDVTNNFNEVDHFKREFLLKVNGVVRPRPEGTINPRMVTGEIEVLVKDFEIINKCETLPFDIDEEHFNNEVSEEIRLEYRYLDLRRKEMFETFKRRHKFVKAIRDHLDSLNFIDVETPFLTKSTPEGARDMLVPSRKHQGSFYALPQSPQLFKQLLMVAGFEKYYQVVRCFRDEDSRKDRQLEFTQIDTEMSFTSFEDLRKTMEEALIKGFSVYNKKFTRKDFIEMTYDEAVSRFGSDKPDLRIKGLEMKEINDIAKSSEFAVFKNVASSKGLVKGMLVEDGQKDISRNEIDKLIRFSQEQGAKGMAWLKAEDGTLTGTIAKYFKGAELLDIKNKFGAKDGDLIFFIADSKETTNDVLDALRRKVAIDLKKVDTKKHAFVWITDFPLFAWNEDEKKIDAEHSPFSMPNEEGAKFIDANIKTRADIKKHKDELLKLRADCYDLAYNGIEICSGALRITRPDFQRKIFEIIEMPDETIERQFGWFLKAYKYGAPQHRGLAFGLDRIIMILEEKASIREVMAFPKNKVGFCPLTKSPSLVDDHQLKELSLKIDTKKEKK